MPLRVALVLASVALVLGLAEIVASSIGGRASFRGLHAVRPGAPWLYDLEPGASARDEGGISYRINSTGFRDAERTIEKPADVFRIAVLGDSVAFGYGVEVEEGFTAQAEAFFSRAVTRPRIEVLNFAVSGYNPYTETELYRGVVRRHSPDLVLVQFCINDLNDPTLHFGASTMRRLGALPELAYPNPAAARAAARDPGRLALLCERSALCAAVLGPWATRTRGPKDADEWRTGFEIRAGPEFETEWAWLGARYADLAQSVRADGAEFGIVAFPHAAELVEERNADADAGSGERSATAALAALGRAAGFEVVDLLPALRRAQASGGPLFLDVWHPTIRGHEVAATEIVRTLRCRRMVPGEPPAGCSNLAE